MTVGILTQKQSWSARRILVSTLGTGAGDVNVVFILGASLHELAVSVKDCWPDSSGSVGVLRHLKKYRNILGSLDVKYIQTHGGCVFPEEMETRGSVMILST